VNRECPIIPIGPYHPLLEEPEFFKFYVEGETVVDAELRVGYNHRGIEKLAESKTYDQMVFLVERICGICSTSHPIANVQAVEDIAGVEVPERAKYIRTITGELERIESHLLWVGLAGHFIGYNTVFMWAWRYRDPILDLLEMTTGSRINYANARVGGVRRDIDNAFMPEIIKGIDEFLPPLDMLIKAVLDDPVLHARLKGIGILTKEDAIKYAVAGPTARASGVPIDVRRDDPYAAYDLVDWDVITQEEGDVFAKVVVRLLECVEAARIIKQCAERLPQIDGPICAEVREIPAGEGVGHVEAPRGETFHYVRSDGSPRPVRHKIRAPSFNNVPSFKASCIGYTVSDVTITLASIDPCYSCTERMARVVDRKSGEEILTFADLVKLSQEKTKRIKEEMGV